MKYKPKNKRNYNNDDKHNKTMTKNKSKHINETSACTYFFLCDNFNIILNIWISFLNLK